MIKVSLPVSFSYFRKLITIMSLVGGTTRLRDMSPGLGQIDVYTNVSFYCGGMGLTTVELGVEVSGIDYFVYKSGALAQAAVGQYNSSEIAVPELEQLYLEFVHAATVTPIDVTVEGYTIFQEMK